MRGCVISIFLLASALLVADQAVCASKDTVSYQEFRRLTYSERRSLIDRLPVESQLTAYLNMVGESEPHDLALAEKLAPRGAELLPEIRQRLPQESDWRSSYLIHLLWTIHSLGYVDVSRDQALVDLAQRRINLMKDEVFRAVNNETLANIRSESAEE